MTKKVKTDSELQAWDVYFAAALEQAKQFTSGISSDRFLDEQVKIAGEIADRMIEARRLRE